MGFLFYGGEFYSAQRSGCLSRNRIKIPCNPGEQPCFSDLSIQDPKMKEILFCKKKICGDCKMSIRLVFTAIQANKYDLQRVTQLWDFWVMQSPK